jgi:hypothetical protein
MITFSLPSLIKTSYGCAMIYCQEKATYILMQLLVRIGNVKAKLKKIYNEEYFNAHPIEEHEM